MVLPTQQPLSEMRKPLSICNIEAQVLHLKVFGMVVAMEEDEELYTNPELNPTAVFFNCNFHAIPLHRSSLSGGQHLNFRPNHFHLY